jgi:hypothetical protein
MNWKATFFALVIPVAATLAADGPKDWVRLFPQDGAPKGWKVREWSDVSKSVAATNQGNVIGGTLHGSADRGTWLVSDRLYGDFELEFEWKLGPRGNSGCGMRFPDAGDLRSMGWNFKWSIRATTATTPRRFRLAN